MLENQKQRRRTHSKLESPRLRLYVCSEASTSTHTHIRTHTRFVRVGADEGRPIRVVRRHGAAWQHAGAHALALATGFGNLTVRAFSVRVEPEHHPSPQWVLCAIPSPNPIPALIHPTPTLTITLEPYRKRQLWPFGGPSYQHACYPRWEQPDIISPDSARGNTITWHHYNSLNTTYVAFVIAVCFKRFTSSFAAWSLASSVSFLQSIDHRRVGIQSLT